MPRAPAADRGARGGHVEQDDAQGLKFALRLSDEVYVVQIKTETSTTEDSPTTGSS